MMPPPLAIKCRHPLPPLKVFHFVTDSAPSYPQYHPCDNPKSRSTPRDPNTYKFHKVFAEVPVYILHKGKGKSVRVRAKTT